MRFVSYLYFEDIFDRKNFNSITYKIHTKFKITKQIFTCPFKPYCA